MPNVIKIDPYRHRLLCQKAASHNKIYNKNTKTNCKKRQYAHFELYLSKLVPFFGDTV